MKSQNNEDIDSYKDYTFIMYILCDKSGSFYSKIKNIINIPIVICSTGLSILNTTVFDKDTDISDKLIFINYLGIIFNLLIALSVAILNVFKITEKEFSFKSNSINFLKLHNKINAEIARSKTTSADLDILNIISEYNLLCEHIMFHIPSRIRRDIQKNYQHHKLPMLAINNKKDKRYSFPNIFYITTKQPDDDNTSLSSGKNTVSSTDSIASDIANIAIPTEMPFSIITDNRNSSPIVAISRPPLKPYAHTEINVYKIPSRSSRSSSRGSRSSSPNRSCSPSRVPSPMTMKLNKKSNSFHT